MIRTYFCSLILFCSLSTSLPAQTWMELRAGAIKAMESGSAPDAERALLSAWNSINTDATQVRGRATIAEDLAYLYLDQGRPDASLKFCKFAIDAIRKSDPVKAADLMNSAGVILRTLGNLADAEQMHKNALVTLRSSGGEKTNGMAETHFALGVLYSSQGKLEPAEQQLQSAAALSAPFEKDFPEGRARILDSLARLYTNWGRLSQAERFQRNAWKVAGSIANPDPKLTIDLLDSQGTLYFEREKYAQAERAWKKAREVGSACAVCAIHVYPILSHLGELYLRLGEYDKAEEMLQANITLTGQIPSIPSADRALLIGEMGFVQARRKKFDAARPLLVESITELERSGRPLELALMSSYYGQFFAQQGYWDQAVEQYERAVRIRREVLGKHPLTITALLNCADAYKKLKRKSEAKKYIELAQDMTLQCASCENQGQTVDVRSFR